MKILIAPLNWGLGHATRCIPIVRYYLAEGHEVVLGGDGESLLLLRKVFPSLRVMDLPSLELRYTNNPQQRGFYLKAIWALMRFTIADHYYLQQRLAIEHFDLIISDNRFGLYTREVRSIYITHQLYPILPKRLRIFQACARALHACIYKKYAEVWVPDYADNTQNLSGELSHGGKFDRCAKYIGPISRFTPPNSKERTHEHNQDLPYHTVAILSGLEPQRSIFEQELLQRFAHTPEKVLLIRGKVSGPQTTITRANITIKPSITEQELMMAINCAEKVVARSGYSTIMDLHTLGALPKAELHPTPGQSEQEYLAQLHRCNLQKNS